MKLMIDWGPFALFGLTYFGSRDIYAATIVLMASLWIALALDGLTTRRLNKVLLTVAIAASILGGLTLRLRDPMFIQLKPTLVYGVFALICLGSQFIGDKVLMERLAQSALILPDAVWRRLNLAWALFFAGCAALNFYVAQHFAEATWVKFKIIALTVLPFAFALAQTPFLLRYIDDGARPGTLPGPPDPPPL
jgi:intracellular septation protein